MTESTKMFVVVSIPKYLSLCACLSIIYNSNSECFRTVFSLVVKAYAKPSRRALMNWSEDIALSSSRLDDDEKLCNRRAVGEVRTGLQLKEQRMYGWGQQFETHPSFELAKKSSSIRSASDCVTAKASICVTYIEAEHIHIHEIKHQFMSLNFSMELN